MSIWAAAIFWELQPEAPFDIPHEAAFVERFVDMVWLNCLEEAESGTGRHLLPSRAERELASCKQAREVTAAAERSLRRVRSRKGLRWGSSDFLGAAKPAAVNALRRAATEILSGKGGIWCEIAALYLEGYWPCGVLANRDLVVY